MLWTKSWLETRSRFLIGVALTLCSAAATVLMYPRVLELLPAVPRNVEGELGRRIRESVELARTFGGYIGEEWFRNNLRQLATLFAILLGAAGLFARGATFTLSLPFSRQRLIGVRAAVGLGELFVLVLVPSLLVPILAPAIGQSYGLDAALLNGVRVFVAVSVFYALALLLSTIFLDSWRPVLIALAVAFVFSVFRAVSAEWWFLFASGIVAAGLYGGAVANVARRDF